MDMFIMLIVVMAVQVNVYVITYQTVYFIYVYMIACQLYLSNEKKKKTLPFIIPCIVVENKTIWSTKKSQVWVDL